MIELIDKSSNKKMMVMVMCGIKYQDDNYLLYCIRREKEDANIFISKLVINSEGYTINNDFDNGEKEAMEDVVKKIINMTTIDMLNNQGFEVIKDIKLDGINYFDVKKCYVSTVSRNLIKSIMDNYGLISDSIKYSPIVEVKDDKKFNQGFISNIALIVFGIFLLMFCIGIIYDVFIS